MVVERRSPVRDLVVGSQTGGYLENWRGSGGLKKARSPERGVVIRAMQPCRRESRANNVSRNGWRDLLGCGS